MSNEFSGTAKIPAEMLNDPPALESLLHCLAEKANPGCTFASFDYKLVEISMVTTQTQASPQYAWAIWWAKEGNGNS